MQIFDDTKQAVVSWLARQLVRPVWQVGSEGPPRPLNVAADATNPEPMVRFAAAVKAGGDPDKMGPHYDVCALGEDFGGGFLVAYGKDPSFLERALPRAVKEWDISEREMQALRLRCDGLSAKQIAARLGISEHTATDHLRKLREKSRSSSAVEMLGKLLKMG